MLLGLRIGPVADHLLLGPHVLDEALDRFGEIGHRGGRGLVDPAPPSRRAAARSRRPFRPTAPLRRRIAADVAADVAHRGREPVFEVGVEAVLRLARSAGRGSRAPASRQGRTARTRTKCPCRRAGRRGLPSASRRSLPASPPTLRPSITRADRADGLDQAPEGAEQAEEDQEARHVAREVAPFVEPGGDRSPGCRASSAARSPCGRGGRRRIDAIGASRTGGRATVMPGSASRKPLTQVTSGNSRMTCRNANRMPMTSTPMIIRSGPDWP